MWPDIMQTNYHFFYKPNTLPNAVYFKSEKPNFMVIYIYLRVPVFIFAEHEGVSYNDQKGFGSGHCHIEPLKQDTHAIYVYIHKPSSLKNMNK